MLTVDVVPLADADNHQEDNGHQREVVLDRLEVADRRAKVLASVLEQGVRQLLHEHPREREHGDARVLDLALAELLHVDRAELLPGGRARRQTDRQGGGGGGGSGQGGSGVESGARSQPYTDRCDVSWFM